MLLFYRDHNTASLLRSITLLHLVQQCHRVTTIMIWTRAKNV